MQFKFIPRCRVLSTIVYIYIDIYAGGGEQSEGYRGARARTYTSAKNVKYIYSSRIGRDANRDYALEVRQDNSSTAKRVQRERERT